MDNLAEFAKRFKPDPEQQKRFEERVAELKRDIDRRVAEANARRSTPEWMERRMTAAGVPPRFRQAKVSDFPHKVYHPYMTRWLKGESGLLHGGVGTGKTHFAVALLRSKLEFDEYRAELKDGDRWVVVEPMLPLFTSVPKLLQDIRGTFGDNDATNRLISLYQNASCLVLDDLGAEKSSEWSLEILYLIIDGRYSGLRQLLVTSNLKMDDIAARLGDRVASRLSGLGFVLELAGKDRRVNR